MIVTDMVYYRGHSQQVRAAATTQPVFVRSCAGIRSMVLEPGKPMRLLDPSRGEREFERLRQQADCVEEWA